MTADFETLDLNTNVSALMELSNALGEFRPGPPLVHPQLLKFTSPATASAADVFAIGEALEALVLMLAPFSPHVAEEMWEQLGHPGGLLKSARWPRANSELALDEESEIPLQGNGKKRSLVKIAADASPEELKAAALLDEKLGRWIEGFEELWPEGVGYDSFVVPKRKPLVNIVVKRGPTKGGRLDRETFKRLCDEALKDLPYVVTDPKEQLEIRREEAVRHLYLRLRDNVGSLEEPLVRLKGSAYQKWKQKIALYYLHHSDTFIRTEPLVEDYARRAIGERV